MFNKNGQKLLNTNYGNMYSSDGYVVYFQLLAIGANNTLTTVSGDAINRAFQYYHYNGLGGDLLIQAVTKHTLLGFHGVYAGGNTTATDATKQRGVRYHVGYRSGGFNQDVTAPVDDFTHLVTFSQSYGIKTFTVTNTRDSAITFNEISFSCYITTDTNSTSYVEILFAGFNLGEITIPAGGAYSFTLTHLMESESA